MIIQGTSAVRSLHALLLVVHVRINIVPSVRVGVRVVILLASRHAVVRRLPANRIVHVRAVNPIVGLLLTIGGGRFKDLGWIVARGWVGGERRAVALRSVHWHGILSRRLRARRGLHIRAEVSRNRHSAVHRIHIIIRSLPREPGKAVHGRRWRYR